MLGCLGLGPWVNILICYSIGKREMERWLEKKKEKKREIPNAAEMMQNRQNDQKCTRLTAFLRWRRIKGGRKRDG